METRAHFNVGELQLFLFLTTRRAYLKSVNCNTNIRFNFSNNLDYLCVFSAYIQFFGHVCNSGIDRSVCGELKNSEFLNTFWRQAKNLLNLEMASVYYLNSYFQTPFSLSMSKELRTINYLPYTSVTFMSYIPASSHSPSLISLMYVYIYYCNI